MDFGSLLQAAKHNQVNNRRDVRTYNTKFTAPKKEEKKAKNLSANIQKFLARKEDEEKRRQNEANRKRDDLLALRSKDKKATRRVNVMLKRTKSANQSVIDDAVDKDNTAVTLVGPSQPDEDDYGYVSQEASAFYNKMMEKYSKLPDDPKFPTAKKSVSHNLSSTKDRVKAALEREKEEALLPHRRKRKHKEDSVGSETEAELKIEVKTKPKLLAPPPLNFMELLKIAEKKQHEPVKIEVKPKEDDGPPMTKKQRREFERIQQVRESKKHEQPSNKIPKLSEKPTKSNALNATVGKYIPSIAQLAKQVDKFSKPGDKTSKPLDKTEKPLDKISKPCDKPSKMKPEPVRKVLPEKTSCDIPYKAVQADNKYDPSDSKLNLSKPVAKTKQMPPPPPPAAKKSISAMDIRKRELLEQHMRRKALQEANPKPKQFPPADVAPIKRPASQNEIRRKPLKNNKRRILDSDEEYDSEMDDFIDDGPEEMEDYSKHIKEIFGYDKSKYRGYEEDVDNMESSFSQQMKEDVRSTKLGIMEDLEDIKREREQKRRKAEFVKKRK